MPLPPWLDVRPRDFADSAQAGLTLGLRRRQLGQDAAQAAQRIALGSAELNQRASERTAANEAELAQLAFANQKLQQEREIAEMEAAAKEKVADTNFQTQKARDNVTNAYRTATLQLRQKQIEDAAKEKAMNIADVQGYYNALNSGSAPEQAAAQFPRAVTAGMGSAMTRSENSSAAEKMSDRDRIRYQHALSTVDQGNRALTEAMPGSDVGPLKESISSAKRAIDEIESRYNNTAKTSTGTQNSLEGKRVRNKKTGQIGRIVNGQFVADAE